MDDLAKLNKNKLKKYARKMLKFDMTLGAKFAIMNLPHFTIPGQANPALHEEMNKLFTRSHLANPGRPGSREGCPGLARCERLTRLSCKR